MRTLLLASAATMLAVGAAFAQPDKQVAAPGTVVVHLHGYFQYSVGAYGATNMSGGSVAAGNAYELSKYGTAGDFRLYPGFDGQTLNGIWYGVQAELRTAKGNAGAGKNNNTVNGNGFSSLYVQRAYAYIGTPNYGFARLGQTDSAFSLSQAGVVEKFGDGSQFNADGGANLMLPSAPGLFIYADTSVLYSTNKIVYVSPSFGTDYGNFSGIIGFEPNSNGIKQGYADPGSDVGANDSAIYGGSNKRRRNTVDASLSYANDIEGFATKASVAYLHSDALGILGAAPKTAPHGYSAISVFQAGAQTSYAGLTVGANTKWGQVEDSYSFKPEGARNAFGYIVGASYNVGPYTVGTSYFNEQSSGKYIPGSTSIARTLNEYGVAAGADYQLAKPISLFIQYEYGHQHQPTATTRGNVQEQVVAVGTTIKW